MNRTRFVSLLVLTLACSARAELPPGWGTNLTAVLADAETRQQPVLVFFTASWCGPCKLMVRTTLTNETVLAALTGLHHIAVDIDAHPDVAQLHGVSSIPAFRMLTPSGKTVASLTGYQDSARFVAWLTNSVGEVRQAVSRRQRAEEALARAYLLLKQSDPDSIRRGAQELFDLCGEPEGSVGRAAVGRLTVLARERPAALLEGLQHPRLAVRIETANLLRAQVGDAFDIDPWSDAATRQQAVAAWRTKLETSTPAK